MKLIKRILLSAIIPLALFVAIFVPRYYLVSLLLMVLSLGLFLYKLILFKTRIRKEKNEIKNSIDSIVDGGEPEIIIRNNNILILDDVKKDIYELARIFRDDVDFLRHDVLDNLDIPIYIESSGRVFKNKIMKKICFDLKKEAQEIESEFEHEGVSYKKINIKDSFFYFLPVVTKIHSV